MTERAECCGTVRVHGRPADAAHSGDAVELLDLSSHDRPAELGEWKQTNARRTLLTQFNPDRRSCAMEILLSGLNSGNSHNNVSGPSMIELSMDAHSRWETQSVKHRCR